MATIFPSGADPTRRTASSATQNEQPRRQLRSNASQGSTRHHEPTDAQVMAEAAAIYPDTSPDAPTREEIAAEAYAIYLGRGAENGRDLEDWLEAERLLRRVRPTRPMNLE